MASIGMMDSRRTSKNIENKRRRNNDNRGGDRKDLARRDLNRHLYPQKKIQSKEIIITILMGKISVRDQR